MYTYIYFFIHCAIEKKHPDPKFLSAGVVAFIQWVHLNLIAICLYKLFNFRIIPVFNETYIYNKLLIMPFLLIWMIITHKYFNKRFIKLSEQYSGKEIVNIKNTIIVFSILILPIISIILLLKI
jgi:hypothetical protein